MKVGNIKITWILIIMVSLSGHQSLLAQGLLFGTTRAGGSTGGGVLYKTQADSSTFLEVVKEWTLDTPGAGGYASLIKATNGKLYGVTPYGGKYDAGVIFEYGSGVYTAKYHFNVSGPEGSLPVGGLVQALNGKLYGTTQNGGANFGGVLYELDPVTGIYTVKLQLSSSVTGISPNASMIRASNGKLYGVMAIGGTAGYGVLFEYNPDTNIYLSKYNFDNVTGYSPRTSLIEGTGGKLYGVTQGGGANGEGVIFEYDLATSVFTKRFDFVRATGAKPSGSLVQAANGKLYGMTPEGGTSIGGVEGGVLYEFDLSNNQYTVKRDFGDATIGRRGFGGLIEAPNGRLYGLVSGNSTFYEVAVIIEFDPSSGGTVAKYIPAFRAGAGNYVYGTMLLDGNNLYSVLPYGGKTGYGALINFNTATDGFATVFSFSQGSDGAFPVGGVTLASNGKLYGMVSDGGASENGLLYEYDPATGHYEKKHDFNGLDGSTPLGGLTAGSNGKLYGTTTLGGNVINPEYYVLNERKTSFHEGNGVGVLFEYDPSTNTYSKKTEFSLSTGYNPYGRLIEASNGKFYGTTNHGGVNSRGTIYEYDPTLGVITKKVDFPASTSGFVVLGPRAGLTAANGKLYGLTPFGGSNNGGALYEFNPVNGDFAIKFSFSSQSDISSTSFGATPFGELTLGNDGKLYGLTSKGGTGGIGSYGGVIFQYDPVTEVCTKMKDLTVTNGVMPAGNFIADASGKFYATANMSAYAHGTVFQYDPAANVLTRKFEFNQVNGDTPGPGTLALVNAKMRQTVYFSALAVRSYGNIPFTLPAKASSGLPITYSSSDNNIATINGDVLTIVGTGTVMITASQPGDAHYYAATDVTQSLTVLKALQTISFSNNNFIKKFTDASFDPGATATSGLPVSYSSSNLAVAKVEGNMIVITGAGSCSITASQAGNSLYFAAPNQTRQLAVNSVDQTITFAALPSRTMGDVPFNVTATASSGLPVSLATSSDKITINGTLITLKKPGSVTIFADQPGNAGFNAALRAIQTFCINPEKPTVTLTGANTENILLTSSAADRNQWFLNGTAIPLATSATYKPAGVGIYNVQVSVEGCVSAFSNDQAIIVTGDVAEDMSSDLRVYPNPASDRLHIDLPGHEVMSTVHIMRANGAAMEEHTTRQESLEVDVADYATGMYIIRVKHGNTVQYRKFIRQ